MMEKIKVNEITCYLKRESLLSLFQAGFRTRGPTVTYLVQSHSFKPFLVTSSFLISKKLFIVLNTGYLNRIE